MVDDPDFNRRRFIETVGVSGALAFAGCTGNQGEQTTTTSDPDTTTTDSGTTTTAQQSSDPIKIGFPFPLTGELAFTGQSSLTGALTAQDEIHSAGGIDGRQIQLIQEDNKAAVDQSITVTEKLINVDQVHAISGYTTLTIMNVMDLLRNNQVPTMFTCGSSSAFDSVGGEYVFRMYPSDSLGGAALVLSTREEFNGVQNFDNMLIFAESDSPQAQSYLEPIQNAMGNVDGTVSAVLEYSREQSSYSSLVDRGLQNDPDIITLLSRPENAVQIMRDGFNAGYEGAWMGNEDHVNEDFINLARPELIEDMYGFSSISPTHVSEERRQSFAERHRSVADTDPGLCSTHGYDSIIVLGLAMKSAMENDSFGREGIAAELPKVAAPPGTEVSSYEEGASLLGDGEDINYQGLSSTVDWTENGEIATPFIPMQVQDNAWTEIGNTISPQRIVEVRQG